LIGLFLLFHESRVAFAGNQTAEVVETDHVMFFQLLLPLPIINGKRFDQVMTLFLGCAATENLFIKIAQLRS
jgi:hypothetical protein